MTSGIERTRGRLIALAGRDCVPRPLGEGMTRASPGWGGFVTHGWNRASDRLTLLIEKPPDGAFSIDQPGSPCYDPNRKEDADTRWLKDQRGSRPETQGNREMAERTTLLPWRKGSTLLTGVRNTFVSWFKDEEGASLVEYVLMVALIAVVCIAAVTLLGTAAKGKFETTANAIKG